MTDGEEYEDDVFDTDNDEDGWDGAVLNYDQQALPTNYNITHKDACWICNICNITLNIQLTIEKYAMRCFKCNESQYNHGQTKITHSNTWKTPQHYHWNCSKCTFRNTVPQSSKCEMCHSTKTSFYDSIAPKQNSTSWICKRCRTTNICTQNQCKKCGIQKPLKRANYTYSPQSIVLGYIRIYILFGKEAPKDLLHLCLSYFRGIDVFKYFADNNHSVVNKYMKPKNIVISQESMVEFFYGAESVNYGVDNGCRWRIKVADVAVDTKRNYCGTINT